MAMKHVEEVGISSKDNDFFSTLKSMSLHEKYTQIMYTKKLRTETIRVVHRATESSKKSKSLIMVQLEKDIVGREDIAYLSWDFLLTWCNLDEIDVHHIFV